MSENTLSSGFFREDLMREQETFSELQEFYESNTGYSRLFLFRRYGKRYILKCLRPLYRDQIFHEQLLQKEFHIGYSLDHPHICHTLEWRKEKKLGYGIVMEYIDGITLQTFMQQGKLTRSLALKFIAEIGDALQYLHNKQLVHKDLKPTNILITHNGNNVKIIDFGLSDQDDYDIFKLPAGTRKYIAPEQLTGKYTTDCRSDIYSLGVIIKEMATHLKDRQLMKIANKCSKDRPEHRYSSATEVVEALKKQPHSYKKYGVIAILLIACLLFYIQPIPTPPTTPHLNNDSDTHTHTIDTHPKSTPPPLRHDTLPKEEKQPIAPPKRWTKEHPFYREAQKVLTGGLTEKDSISRQVILNYMEHFRTSYTTKDIDFLEQLFSEDALIVVGTVVKKATKGGIHYLSDEQVRYNVKSKKEYLRRLREIFHKNQVIDVRFSDFSIRRHPTRKGIYGVSVKQRYTSDSYSDEGYLFLLWDFKERTAPRILVRTWQPRMLDHNTPLPEQEIFTIASFNLE